MHTQIYVYVYLNVTKVMLYTQTPSVKTLQQQIRISLKNLKSLSYNLTEPVKLEGVLKLTTRLEQMVRDIVPTHSGLLLWPSSTSSIIARKIRLKYKRAAQWRRAQAYLSLPKGRKRGRPKALRKKKKKVRCIHHTVYTYPLKFHSPHDSHLPLAFHKALQHNPQKYKCNPQNHLSPALYM